MQRTLHYIYQWLCIFSSFPQQQFLKCLRLIASFVIITVILFSTPLSAQEIINPKSGKLFAVYTDLLLPAGPINLEIKRTLLHNNRNAPGLLGNRWRIDWERQLVRLGSIALISESNGSITYNQIGNRDEYQSFRRERIIFNEDGSAIHLKRNGIKETFDPNGRLISINYPSGNEIKLTYHSFGQISRIDGPRENFFKLFYNEDQRLLCIKSSSLDTIDYVYDQDNLIQVKINKDTLYRYEYSPKGELIKIDRPGLGGVEFVYDAKGRVITRHWADGSEERFEYDDVTKTYRHISPSGGVTTSHWSHDGRQQEVTDPLGNKSIIKYDENGRYSTIINPMGKTSRFTYDELGRTILIEGCCGKSIEYEYLNNTPLIKSVAASNSPCRFYDYNHKHNLIAIREGDQLVVSCTYYPDGLLKNIKGIDFPELTYTYHFNGLLKSKTNINGESTEYEYNQRGNLIRIIDPSGEATVYDYDAQGKVISITESGEIKRRYIYDKAGRRIRVIDPVGGIIRYEYDSRGRLSKKIDQAGRITAYSYDTEGQLIRETDTDGNVFQYGYDANGNQIEEIDPMGGITKWKYNPIGQVISETDPTGRTWQYEYSDDGFLTKAMNPSGEATHYRYGSNWTETLDPLRRKTRFEYDEKNRLIKMRYPDGLVEKIGYDGSGNMTEETNNCGRRVIYEYDALGRIVKKQWNNGYKISYRYDSRGNVLEWRDTLGNVTTKTYNNLGLPTSEKDVSGNMYKYQYNTRGLLTKLIDPLGHMTKIQYSPVGDLTQVIRPSGDKTEYDYDKSGRLQKVRHPSGGETRFNYDKMGNRISAIDLTGKAIRYIYDKAGRLIQLMDAKGQVTKYIYDTSDRITKKILSDGKTVTYRYDPSGNLLEVNDGFFPVHYRYNDTGLLTQITYSAIGKILNYNYNESGRLSKFIDTEGQTISYEYNDRNLVSLLKIRDETTFTFFYDKKDRISSITYPNGIKGTWRYGPNGRIAAISYTNKKGKTVIGWHYTYDAAGNLIETHSSGGEKILYEYDESDQLLEEKSLSGTIHYSYLPGGNRSKCIRNAETVMYQYNISDQLIKAGDENFKYDANGNLVERQSPSGTTRYVWNSENRLVKVVQPNGQETRFGYAPTGERIWREDAKGRIWLMTDGVNLLAEINEKHKSKRNYLHAPGIDFPLMMHTDKANYFYLLDGLGNIAALTDNNSTISNTYQTDAFGNPRKHRFESPNPFIFASREYEPELCLFYFRERYYDPSTGRFISKDPEWSPTKINPYIYALNAPTRYRDPMGSTEIPNEWLDQYGLTPGQVENQLVKPSMHKEALSTWKSEKIFHEGMRIGQTRGYEKGLPLKKTPFSGENYRPFARHYVREQILNAPSNLKGSKLIQHVRGNIAKDIKHLRQDFRSMRPSSSLQVAEQRPPSPSQMQRGAAETGAAPAPQADGAPRQLGNNNPTRTAPRPEVDRPRAPQRSILGPTRQAHRPGVGTGSRWARFKSGTGKAISGTAQWISKHPKTVYVAMTLAHWQSCKERNMSFADCALEHAAGHAAVHVIVKFGGGTILIYGGGIYGIVKTAELGYELYQLPKDYLQRLAEEEKRKAQAEENRQMLLKEGKEFWGKLDNKIGVLSHTLKRLNNLCKALASAANEAKKHAAEAMKIAQPVDQILSKAKSTLSCCETVAAVEGELIATQGRIQKSANRMKTSLTKSRALAETCKTEEDAAKIMAEFNLAKGLYNYVTEQYEIAQAKAAPLKKCKDKASSGKSVLSAIPKIKEQVYAEAEKALKHFNNFGETFVKPAEAQNKVLDAMCDRLLRVIIGLRYAMGEDPLLKGNEAEFAKRKADVERYRAKKCKTAEHHKIHNQAMGDAYKARGITNKTREAAEIMAKLIPCAKPGIKGLNEIKAIRADAVVAMHAALDIPQEANACVLVAMLDSLDDDDKDDKRVASLKKAETDTDSHDTAGDTGSNPDINVSVPDTGKDTGPSAPGVAQDERNLSDDATATQRGLEDDAQNDATDNQIARVRDEHESAEGAAESERNAAAEARDTVLNTATYIAGSALDQGGGIIGTAAGLNAAGQTGHNDKDKDTDSEDDDSDTPRTTVITAKESASASNSGGQSGAPIDTVIDISSKLSSDDTVTGVSATLNGNAYRIPDQFQIIYQGKVIKASGLISGGTSVKGSAKGSSPQVVMRVIASKERTKWTWTGSASFTIQKTKTE